MKNPLTTFSPRLRSRLASPWRAVSDLEEEVERWLEPLRTSALREEIGGMDFIPACNLRENDKEYVVKFDIPGVKKEDVKVELEGQRLTVRGSREEQNEEKDAKHFMMESSYGSFIRSLILPNEVNEKKVDAHYEHGVLTITIPKIEASRAKEIAVH